MVAELRSLVGESKGFDMSAHSSHSCAEGLHTAMTSCRFSPWLLALVLFAASRTVKKDVEKLQTWMRTMPR